MAVQSDASRSNKRRPGSPGWFAVVSHTEAGPPVDLLQEIGALTATSISSGSLPSVAWEHPRDRRRQQDRLADLSAF
jgi:hypothetical protein